MTPDLRLSNSLQYDTLPYKSELDSLDLEITEFALGDDDPITPDDPTRLSLDEYSGWETVSLMLSVSVPDHVLNEVFPGDSPYPGNVVVAGHCIDTYLRGGTILNDDEISPGTISDTYELSAEKIAGTVELTPYLIRSQPLDESGLDADHDYATIRGEMLANGATRLIQIDEQTPGQDDVLAVDRVSFEAENENEDSPFPDADRLYYLDLKRDPDNPILYFNEDHDRIVDLVWNADSTYEDRTADLIWDQVMTPVWTRMIQLAAIEYDPDVETWTPEWQPAVLDIASSHLYPDKDSSPQNAAQSLQVELNEDVLSGTERIENAVQGILRPATQLNDHITQLGNS